MSGHTNYSCICMDIIVKYARAGKKLLSGLRLAAYCDLNVERRLRGIIYQVVLTVAFLPEHKRLPVVSY